MSKILLIEDDKLLQEAARDKFSKSGFSVYLADDGKQGIVSAVNNQPDLIILDLIMPVMDGTTALRHLKQMPETKAIPVVLLTAVADGVPQALHDDKLFESVAGYLEKDKSSLDSIVAKATEILQNKTN